MSETCSHGYRVKTAWDGYVWVTQHKYWCEQSPLPKPTNTDPEEES
jgi:hypothetical protein